VTVPLIVLAIASVFAGWFTVSYVLFGDFFKNAIFVSFEHDPLRELSADYHGQIVFLIDAFKSPALYLAAAGAVVAWFLYLKRPDLPARWQQQFSGVYRVLMNKYYFDWFYENVLAKGARLFGEFLWKVGDQTLIDGALVNGTAKTVGLVATVARGLQSGYLYHYAFAMIVGLAVLVGWFVFRT
ncbi:MAG TPA: NADH-quinone oxidoreductase subunit L, partial [Gammaproteobacteria bacterium]|nr:NADH-quinone oxidoreductase subunit L [Gammaproteobacteria bacterium]